MRFEQEKGSKIDSSVCFIDDFLRGRVESDSM